MEAITEAPVRPGIPFEDKIKLVVRQKYQTQKRRIAYGQHLVALYRDRILEEITDGTEEELDDKVLTELMRQLQGDYKILTEGVIGEVLLDNNEDADRLKDFTLSESGLGNVSARKAYPFEDAKLIRDHVELRLVDQYMLVKLEELKFDKTIEFLVKQHPLWKVYLQHVYGVGPVMAGVLLSEIDITQSPTASALRSYAGLDTRLGSDGKRHAPNKWQSKAYDLLVDQEYINKEGKLDTRKSLGYNRTLHDKLLGVLGDVMIRSGKRYRNREPDNGYGLTYYPIYEMYKERKARENEQLPEEEQRTDGHLHRMAIRRMLQVFLEHVWVIWRSLEGLYVRDPYEVEKLGATHHRIDELGTGGFKMEDVGLDPWGRPFDYEPVQPTDAENVSSRIYGPPGTRIESKPDERGIKRQLPPEDEGDGTPPGSSGDGAMGGDDDFPSSLDDLLGL